MSNHIQIQDATVTNPKLFLKFPAYSGSYCPHLFWHVTRPETSRKVSFPYYHEGIFSSSWIGKDQCWSKPKRQSLLHATIAILQQDVNPSSPRLNLPHISSIYADPLPFGKHINHPASLTAPNLLTFQQLNTCLPNPTPEQFFNFAFNCGHTFTFQQKLLLTRRLLTLFPSGTEQAKTINDKWDTFQYLHTPPDEQGDYKKSLTGAMHKKFNPPILSLLPEVQKLIDQTTSLHTQLYGGNLPTPTNPLCIRDYPQEFGVYQFRQFWVDRHQSPTTGRLYEFVMSRYWIDIIGNWSDPKQVSPSKGTVCIIVTDNNPLSPTYTLPLFDAIDLYSPTLRPSAVYDFAKKYIFSNPQRNTLNSYLCNHFDQYSDHMQSLYSFWQSQPNFY